MDATYSSTTDVEAASELKLQNGNIRYDEVTRHEGIIKKDVIRLKLPEK